MERFKHLMVGLTRTKQDADLIRYAAMLARLHTTIEIRFVHVLPRSGVNIDSTEHDVAQEAIERHVAECFLNVPDSVRLYCHVLKGPLVDRLLSFVAEQESDLILVGHQLDQPAGGASLVRRLAMQAPCSVWIVPDGSRLRLEKLLVPIDFSEGAADALVVATSMARLAADTECMPLHVYFNEAVLTYEEDDPIVRGREEDAYRQFVAPIDCRDVKMIPMFVEAVNVAHAIHRVASEQSVDLKVISTRGRSRSAAILLGSVAEGVIIEARTPVLIVKHFGAGLGLLQMLLDRTFKRSDAQHFD
jgi:SulP family sulfate permease